MGDALKKVKSGDPLAIPAGAFNSFVDAARDFQARQLAQQQGSQPTQRAGTNIIFVRNDSGEDRERFDVLGIDTPIFTPTDDEDAFKNQVALAGVAPTAVDHTGKFVILLEPVAAGEIGRACISGVCPAWLYVADEGHQFADVYDGDATMLKCGPTGSAQVVWKEEGTGPLWAVVRIGNQVTAMFPAKLTAEDTPGEYGWEEQGLDANGDFVDIDSPRTSEDLGTAREFNDAEGLYTESPTVYVHMFEFTDADGGKRYRFVCPQPVVRWGVLKADWDVNACSNFVLVNPCDKGGGNPDPAVEVKVYLGWPNTGHIAPYFWGLRTGAVIPYVPIGTAGGTPEGTAFRLWSNPVWGKVIDDWQESQNFVMVRLTDEDGVEIGYAANVKCWLYSPENLANVKGVKLQAGDLIRVELPTYDPGTGVSFAHAINVYGGAGKNKLLDGANHTDTADADPAIGDLISAWGDPIKWNRLAVGAAQSLLYVSPGPPIMPGWLAKGWEQSILYVNAGVLDWFNAGLAQSLLITGAGGNLAWKPHGLNESIFITRGGQLDWLAKGDDGSLLAVDAGALAWLPKGNDQSLLYMNVNKPDWFLPGLAQSMLIVGQQGLAWKPRGLDESIYITRNQQLDWLDKGDDPSILVVDGGTVQWSHGTDTTGRGAVLWIDPNGVFGWGQAYHALLDSLWHYDTADALPTKGAMIYMTADPPNGLWDVLDIGADQSFLHVKEGIPAWKDKGDDGAILIVKNAALDWLPPAPDAGRPLLCQAGGPEWFDGPTATLTFVTDIRVDGLNFQKKTRQIEVTKGVICQTGDESDWQTFHTGTECPE